MTDAPHTSQLDRIEAGLGGLREDIAQLAERLARIEERHTGLSSRIETHGLTLERHTERIGQLETSLALAGRDTGSLNSRWAALGAVALVFLSAVGSYVGRIIAP